MWTSRRSMAGAEWPCATERSLGRRRGFACTCPNLLSRAELRRPAWRMVVASVVLCSTQNVSVVPSTSKFRRGG